MVVFVEYIFLLSLGLTVCMHACMSVCMHVYICMHVYVCMHVYISMYTYSSKHIQREGFKVRLS